MIDPVPPASPLWLRARRSSLLLSCALGTVLAVAGPSGRALAQAFQGDPSVVSGQVGFDRGTAGRDVITVGSPTAVVNWDPNDTSGGGRIDFLPQGHTAIFQNNPQSTSDFFILNRIVPADPSRAVAFNGTVISQLQTNAGNVAGGTVAFYSPGGILIGSTATFDVGSLLLTTLDPVRNANGGIIGNGSSLQLRGPDGSSSAITTEAGSTIRAVSEGSYVAMAAPRIQHGGAVRVNGSAGYIAAEAVDLTINDGLFDISVQTGTTQSNALNHTGSTGGPASGGAGDNHNIYMVAVAKNQAITALLSGSVGFDSATSATVENGAIILSAGHNVRGTRILADSNGNGVNSVEANFHVNGGAYSSDVTGRATSDFFVAGQSASTDFAGDVSIQAGRGAHIAGRNGQVVTILGNASVNADRLYLDAGSAGVGATAGEALLYADGGGTLDIRGDASVSADATAGGSISAPALATGGQARIFGSDGTVTIGGAATLSAVANRAFPAASGVTGPAGQGGTAEIFVNSGGSVAISGAARLDATGYGAANGAAGGVGASGRGGNASVFGGGGEIAIGGIAFLTADGVGGDGRSGGTGQGGSAGISATEGSIELADAAIIRARGTGGNASAGFGGTGGAGTGGVAFVEARQTATEGGTITGQDVLLDVSGFGGRGGAGDGSAIAAGAGGAGSGGTFTGTTGSGGAFVLAQADRGRLSLGEVILATQGIGGAGGSGGAGQAGGAGGTGTGGSGQTGTFLGDGDGLTLGGSAAFGNVSIDASGLGGAGGSGAAGSGDGGDAAGGAAAHIGRGTAVTAGRVDLFATARGGAGAAGGNAVGGAAEALADGGSLAMGDLAVDAGAVGGAGAAGGGATGGTAQITAHSGGRIDVEGAINATSSGFGGESSGAQSAGGAGQGGATSMVLDNGRLAVGGMTNLFADGIGGAGSRGGDGSGGSAEIHIQSGGGTLTAGSPTLVQAAGNGGDASGGGAGGRGAGGTASLTVAPGAEASAVVAMADTYVNAAATGGNGAGAGAGGDGEGGVARVALTGGSAEFGELRVFTTTRGGQGGAAAHGNGGSGGSATAGDSSLIVGGQLSTSSHLVYSRAFGGAGGAGSVRGAGGDATGGMALIDVNTGGSLASGGLADINATATGGAGGIGGNATGGSATFALAGGQATLQDATVDASAFGGAGNSGAGGEAEGGSAAINASGGTLTTTGPVQVLASASGGAGAGAGAGGRGEGGAAPAR
ncbi:MAG TPA: hypothetical protein VF589_06005, partial [Allosphingosinicella sp.]